MTTRQDFEINQGASFAWTYTWRDSAGDPVDLTGYSARLSIREHVRGVLELNLVDGDGITLGGDAGTIAIVIGATQLTDLVPISIYEIERSTSEQGLVQRHRPVKRKKRLMYDLELVAPDDTVTRVLEGKITVYREITE